MVVCNVNVRIGFWVIPKIIKKGVFQVEFSVSIQLTHQVPVTRRLADTGTPPPDQPEPSVPPSYLPRHREKLVPLRVFGTGEKQVRRKPCHLIARIE